MWFFYTLLCCQMLVSFLKSAYLPQNMLKWLNSTRTFQMRRVSSPLPNYQCGVASGQPPFSFGRAVCLSAASTEAKPSWDTHPLASFWLKAQARSQPNAGWAGGCLRTLPGTQTSTDAHKLCAVQRSSGFIQGIIASVHSDRNAGHSSLHPYLYPSIHPNS